MKKLITLISTEDKTIKQISDEAKKAFEKYQSVKMKYTINLEVLKQKAWEINELLTEYVAMHNHFLKSTGTFASLFRKIDFGKLSDEVRSLLVKFQNIKTELEEIATLDWGDKEKQFAECLLSYTNALTETVSLLDVMYIALNNKASGGSLSFKEHSENNKKYQDAIKAYVSQGDQLNILYRSL